MIAVKLLISAFYLLVMPVAAGSIFRVRESSRTGNLVFQWVGGQIFLWACFQLLCVPMILLEADFAWVRVCYSVFLALVMALAVVLRVRRKKKRVVAVTPIRGFDRKNAAGYILWVIFFALLLLQLVQAVRMTYRDGDDAFYVAVSSITQDAQTMYRKLPYTGFTTELDVRHGLAPFPIWIAYLAEMTDVRAVSMAHVILPVVLIAMTYGIFYLLGDVLIPEKEEGLPLFLIFTELLVLFGDYSFYTPENFMIARSRQGKAALGNIVIPMLWLLLLLLFRRLKQGKKIPLGYYVLFVATALTGCLCSTLGAMLICVLAGVAGLCAAIVYRRWKILIPLALCCLPNVCYTVLYFVLE